MLTSIRWHLLKCELPQVLSQYWAEFRRLSC